MTTWAELSRLGDAELGRRLVKGIGFAGAAWFVMSAVLTDEPAMRPWHGFGAGLSVLVVMFPTVIGRLTGYCLVVLSGVVFVVSLDQRFGDNKWLLVLPHAVMWELLGLILWFPGFFASALRRKIGAGR